MFLTLKEKEKETHIHPKPIHDQKTGKVKIKGSQHHKSYDLILRTFEKDESTKVSKSLREIFKIVDTVKTNGSIRNFTLNTHSTTPVESSNLLIIGNSTPSVYSIAFTNTTYRQYCYTDEADPFQPNLPQIFLPGFPVNPIPIPPNVLAFTNTTNITNTTNTTSTTNFFDYKVNDSLSFLSLIDEKVELKVELGDNFKLCHIFTLAEENVTFLINNKIFPGLNKIKESTPKIFRVVDVISGDFNLEFIMCINDPIISNQS